MKQFHSNQIYLRLTKIFLFSLTFTNLFSFYLCQHEEEVNLNLDRINGKKSFLLDGGLNLNPFDPIARVAGGFWTKVFKPVFGKPVENVNSHSPNNNIIVVTSTTTTSEPKTPPPPPVTMMTIPFEVTQSKGVEVTTLRTSSTMRPSTTPVPTYPPVTMSASVVTLPPVVPPSTSTSKPTLPPITMHPTQKPTLSEIISTPLTIKPIISTPPTVTKQTLPSNTTQPNLTTAFLGITSVPTHSTSTPPTSTTFQPSVSTVTPTTDQLLNCIDWLLEWLQSNNSSFPLRSKSHPRQR